MPVRYVPESPRFQLSNAASYVLLASVLTELQATMKIGSTSKFLLNLKIDILMPRHLLAPVRYIPESPQCQLSNATSHILLALALAELQAAIEIGFTSKFLLTLKTDSLTLRFSFMPIRHAPGPSPCQLSNDTFCAHLA
ncbi:hypothetical protein L873DRAFT_1791843 [Choiromyces venosus 120613-1]|uniref:Uncharacterized protein n=1 Tax=Choiromyces venosus 120613-1 TaxID=1336337 RepID=A0A3N4JCW8_9PEZI|nr:hypothetical protein L873DRAFT_1791843 [Choiromyces venosus 120613-1]